jgi:hypothetical protein
MELNKKVLHVLKEADKERLEKKIAKESVLYIFKPETQTTCDVCVFSKDKNNPDSTKKCKLLGPTTEIKAYGSCGMWSHMDPSKEKTPEVPMLGIFTKLQVGYYENKQGFTCKRCEYFDYEKNDCYKVDKDSEGDTPGMVHPDGCCNNWSPDSVRSKMSTEEINEWLDKKVKSE